MLLRRKPGGSPIRERPGASGRVSAKRRATVGVDCGPEGIAPGKVGEEIEKTIFFAGAHKGKTRRAHMLKSHKDAILAPFGRQTQLPRPDGREKPTAQFVPVMVGKHGQRRRQFAGVMTKGQPDGAGIAGGFVHAARNVAQNATGMKRFWPRGNLRRQTQKDRRSDRIGGQRRGKIVPWRGGV